MMLDFLKAISAALVLFYGFFLSVAFSGGCKNKKEKRVIAALCLVILLLQYVFWKIYGITFAKQIYPLFSHLPILLTLVFVLKKPFGVALVSVLTAYFCCQLPRWVGAIFLHIFDQQIAFYISYIISNISIFFLLKKFFVTPAHRAMTYSTQSLILFCGLPLFYYVFDYATTVYTNALYEGTRMVAEFLPAVMALFFVAFLTSYHNEVQRRNETEIQNSLLAMKIEQAKNDIFTQKMMQGKTAIYRHDMRHHLTMIDAYLKVGEIGKATEYIQSVQKDIELFTPKCYCENVSMNLTLSAFYERAKNMGVELRIEADIPQSISIAESSLCALFSNALENAILATAKLSDDKEKIVYINCQVHKGNLLIYIKNPYIGEEVFQNELPETNRPGHGFGVKSIKLITDNHSGYCAFEGKDGIFTLKVVLPLGSA
ncbi:MAG: GHKL domain-containing protein [Monoglobales bacterium]